MLTKSKIKEILHGDERHKVTPDLDLKVDSFDNGLKIWNHPDVLAFYKEKSMTWIPENSTAVFLPCSAHKPYVYSQSHRRGYLKALEPYLEDIDLFVVSEPMGVVPYCYSDTYPVTSYDYDPYSFFINHMSNLKAQKSREIFVERVSKWLTKYHPKYRKKILILPKSWHLKIFKKAVKTADLNWGEYKIVYLTGRPHICAEYMKKQLDEYL